MSTAPLKLVIIDYGVGNLFSLTCALGSIGAQVTVSAQVADIQKADALVLPGVGAFGDAAGKLRSSDILDALDSSVAQGTPLLGICLGAQLLFEKSFEYGEHQGLGYLPGQVVSMEQAFAERGIDLKVPHMGWNALDVLQPDDPLLARTKPGSYVYFVHSFYIDCPPEVLVATAEYGIPITAMVRKGSVWGCQFHPEKSGEVGLDILRSFLEMAEAHRKADVLCEAGEGR